MNLRLLAKQGQPGRMGAAYLILIISLVPTFVVFFRTRHNVRHQDEARFNSATRDVQFAVEERTRRYMDLLQGVRGLIQADGRADCVHWDRYQASLNLKVSYPGIAQITFAPRITASEKAAHEAEARRQGLTNYRVKSASGDAETFPAMLIMPFDPEHAPGLGVNYADEPGNREAMVQARLTGQACATPPMALASRPGQPALPGFHVFVPAYAVDITKTNATATNKVFMGYVVGTFQSAELFQGILPAPDRAKIDFEVFDGNDLRLEKLVFDADGNLSHVSSASVGSSYGRRFVSETQTDFAGRAWHIHFTVLPAFEADSAWYVPWVVLLGGLTISGCLFAIGFVQARDRAVAEQLTEDLRRTQERDRLVDRATNDIIWDWDVVADSVTWSETVQESLGYALPMITPALKWWADRLHPQDKARVMEGLHSAVNTGGEFWADEYRFRRGDGGYATVMHRGYIVHDAAGRSTRLLGSIIDITERIRAEEDRRRALRHFETLVNNTPAVAIQIFDREGRIQLWNPASEMLYGFLNKEVIGHTMQEILLNTEDVSSFEKMLAGMWASREPSQPHEWTVRRKDRKLRRVYSTMFPLVFEGEVGAICCMDVDITERQAAEQALAAEKELLSVTLSSIAEGVIATDRAGRVILLNNFAEKLTGAGRAEALGKPLGTVFAPLQPETGEPIAFTPELFATSDGASQPVVREAALPGGNGRLPVAYSFAPIRNSDGTINGLVVVVRDISEEKRNAEERLRAGKLESLGTLAGGIAHDFNNILTIVTGNVSFAQLTLDPDHPAAERLKDAEKAATRARSLTQQLLTFAKGGAPIKQVTNAAELLRESATFALSGSNVRCELSIPPGLLSINVDPGQLGQVINNLVMNAAQAMPEGGVIHVSAENVSQAESLPPELPLGEYVCFMFCDQGVGIAPEILAKIFDPYFSTRKGAAGLGLATVYSIVKKHEGAITVDSARGSGTTVRVFIPATRQAPAQRVTRDGVKPARGHGRILLMDDDQSILTLGRTMLRHLGYEVVTVEDAAAALAAYELARTQNHPFVAVIMDLTIPGGMGGKEVIVHLKALDPEVRAIVSSGYSNDPVMADYESHGFVGVMAKPYTIEDLAATLQTVLGQRSK